MKLEIIFDDKTVQPQVYMDDDEVSKIIIDAPKIDIEKIVGEGTSEERITVVHVDTKHTCPQCGKRRPFEHFYISRKSAYGIETYCIPCRKEIAKKAGRRKKK